MGKIFLKRDYTIFVQYSINPTCITRPWISHTLVMNRLCVWFLELENLHADFVPGIAVVRARDSHVRAKKMERFRAWSIIGDPANAGESRWGWRGIRSSRLDGTRECAPASGTRLASPSDSREIKKKERENRVCISFCTSSSSFFVFLTPSFFAEEKHSRFRDAWPL